MDKTEFKIPKMDCSAEEQLIRMKLDSLNGIQRLLFDLPARKLEVFHIGKAQEILSQLERLNLGATQLAHVENVSTEGEAVAEVEDKKEKAPLIAAFSINAILFVAEFIVGILAYSLGLIADSLDMLADAVVYAMALVAVGGPALKKKNIALLTGYFQGFLACAGLAEVLRRGIAGEGIPDFRAMILLSCIALIGNGTTLLILNSTKKAGVHMKAAWICTSVDVQVNALVILSGAIVFYTGSRYPDLMSGAIIFLLVGNGARRILALAR